MEVVWLVSLIALWGVVLVNLLLTLRVVRWLQSIADHNRRSAEIEDIAELPIGTSAPGFRTKTLSGESVSLADYAGRAVAFIFVSPQCGTCRSEMPTLVGLGPLAKRRAGVELVLVSASGTAETHAWIREIQEDEDLEVNLPILISPRGISEFRMIYNPRGLTPYFCFVDEHGVVRARDPLGSGEWLRLKREWEGSSAAKPLSRPPGRYR